MRRQTVGAQSLKAKENAPLKIDPREIAKAQEEEYLRNLVWAVEHAKKQVDCSSIEGHDYCKQRTALVGDFFIAALLKKEKLLDNVLRNYFVPTLSCPTPHYDQTVYRYNDAKGDIEFLWVVPDEETCMIFKDNKNIVVPDERGLLYNILSFYDGTLFKLAKKLNGETGYAGGSLIEGI